MWDIRKIPFRIFECPSQFLHFFPQVCEGCQFCSSAEEGERHVNHASVYWGLNYPQEEQEKKLNRLAGGVGEGQNMTQNKPNIPEHILVSENGLTLGSGTSSVRNENLRPLLHANIPLLSGKYGLRNHF